jgi:hypothetical protein
MLVARLESSGARYALVGGVAMAFHSLPRFTKDIDLLVRSEDLKLLKDVLGASGYFESAKPWTFKNTGLELHRFLKVVDEEMMLVDVLLATKEEHASVIDQALIAESSEGRVRVARKEDLIAMKRLRNSKQDQADIERLENETS